MWPAANGSINCTKMRPMASREELASPCGTTNQLTSSGVTSTPSRVEAEALHTAAGMLPRAMEVKAMADCTVAGSTHKYITPVYSSGVTKGSSNGRSAQPSNGNNTKVQANTSKCSRQWVMPAMIASRESLVPCMKNNRPMAKLVSHSKPCALRPCAGKKLARSTTAIRVSVKLSGRKRGRAMGCNWG